MLFNSLNFIIFFVAVVVIYYLLPKNSWRKVFLLGASYYFYACFNFANDNCSRDIEGGIHAEVH